MADTMDNPVPLDRTFIQNTHSLYRRLSMAGPVHRVTVWQGVKVWLVTRYAEARLLLADPGLSKRHDAVTAAFEPSTTGPTDLSIGANMLFADPPEHTRLRRVLADAFSTVPPASMRARAEAIADELLDPLERSAGAHPVDLIAGYAAPLPIRVICKLLGVPDRSAGAFRAAVAQLVTATGAGQVVSAHDDLADFLKGIIAQKRSAPSRDLLTALTAASDRGDRLSEDELLATTFLLIFAGYETTTNLLGNGILALLRHPAQLRMLRQDRTLIRPAIEEFLRYESPLNTATLRVTKTDISLGDNIIPANELVLIGLSSANRDGLRFTAPDTLDITRNPRSHLAFGHGAHHCIGASVARMEAEVAFDRLLSRFGSIELDTTIPLRYRHSIMMRGLIALPARLAVSR
ncbi:cytochrome P450 family protein [Mycobacterium sp. NPDC003449]